jgi:hypothetical protein
VSPVRYEPGFYIPEDGILQSHCRENLKPYIDISVCSPSRGRAFRSHFAESGVGLRTGPDVNEQPAGIHTFIP